MCIQISLSDAIVDIEQHKVKFLDEDLVLVSFAGFLLVIYIDPTNCRLHQNSELYDGRFVSLWISFA